MTETIETKVEIDECIRQQPELLEAVTKGTAYLDTQMDIVPPPALISWQLRPLDPQSVELTMRDAGEIEPPSGSRTFPVRELFDPVSRDIWMLRAWRELLRARSRLLREQFDKKFNALDWEHYAQALDEAYKTAQHTNE